jgi:membrane protease YdiL (CAAX protease family)
MWSALLIPLLYTVIAYGAIWLLGFGDFPDAKFVADTRASLGWANASDVLVVGGYFLLMASAGMVLSIAFALGEEIGWRGFLSPHMTHAFGFRTGAILTGLIWAAWHLPLVLFADYHSAAPKWFAAICLIMLLIAMSIIMAWLRLRSGSLWTGALFHASHNQFIQVFFTPATHTASTTTPYLIDEFGVALPIVASLVALLVWWRNTKSVENVLSPAASQS